METFKIHEDQENTVAARKDGEVFAAASQRRALGDLSHFACNQNRNAKTSVVPPAKAHDENKYVRQKANEKNSAQPNIVLPVAQFQAFSVYEEKPMEHVLKREPTFKPFSAVERHQCLENASLENAKDNNTENAKVTIVNNDGKIDKDDRCLSYADSTVKEELVVSEAESPMSVSHDTSVLSIMSVSRGDVSHLQNVEEEYEAETDLLEETTIAQTDREMFFHVVEYRDDIYEYMRNIEVKHRANPRYMRKQPDISHGMRSILVDWLCEVCEEYSQQSETLHLAVSYVDRFLSFMSVVRNKLQLVGTAATFIAAKYEEVYPPEVSEFAYITDNTYTKREVLRMEHLILKVLSFDLSTPTALAFLSHYCIGNALPKKMFHLASYVAELSLLEAEPYLQFKPSVIAASALATARHCLLCRRCVDARAPTRPAPAAPHDDCLAVAWPDKLANASGYQVRDLTVCMRELARTHSHAPLQARRAIPDKYKSNRFDAVSTIKARPMFPVPLEPVSPAPDTTTTTSAVPPPAHASAQPQRVS